MAYSPRHFLRPSHGVVLIWTLFIIKGAFYCLLFPVWEGYDEFAHFAFVQHLAVHHELPVPQTRVSKGIQESLALAPLPWSLRHWPAPYLTHDAYWQLSAGDRADRETRLRAIPSSPAKESGTDFLYEEKQPPLYYFILLPVFMALQGLSLLNAVFALRLVSVLIVSSLVPIAFITARYVFDSNAVALQIAALIAALPELYIDVARVGNESLAIPLCSLFVFASLRTVDESRRIWWAAVALAFGLLTKAYVVTLVPVFLVLCIVAVWPQPRKGLAFSSVISFVALGLAGLWYYHAAADNSGIWIDASPTQAMGPIAMLKRIPAVDWRTAAQSLSLSHLWVGNWSFLQTRSWMYRVFEGIGVLALLGFVRAQFDLLRSETGTLREGHILLLAGVYFSFLTGIAYHVLVNFINSDISSSTGWYLYAVILPEVLLITVGLFLLLPARCRRFAVPVSIGCFALLELYTAHFLLIPYYTGFIAHAPTGALKSFHIAQLQDGGFREMVVRLAANRPPYFNGPVLLILWGMFILSTVALVVIGVRAGDFDHDAQWCGKAATKKGYKDVRTEVW
jgi:hypothetical protein